ncbi:hypothetical protein [Peptoniphilus senegalensis]|uniref:hypothetical protein n=1 Tax=Peptoniphilus senegalensis TaxID=1465757 RepID=UPI0002F5191D|nr:hypothetical protein [Peptoniphilus senegalensis]
MKYQNVRELIKNISTSNNQIIIEKLAYLDLEKDDPDCSFLEITVFLKGFRKLELCSLVMDESKVRLTKNDNNYFEEDIRTIRDKTYEYFKEFVKENL